MLGHRSQRDFEAEIDSHLELEIERLKAQGKSHRDAVREARRNFGNIGVVEDRLHHGQRFAWLEDALRDLQHAWRALLRTPGFLLACVATLALSIGATAGMFNVVNSVLLRQLPFPAAERLVYIGGTAPGSDLPERFDLGGEFYVHYKEQSKLLEGVFALSAGTSTFRTDARVERVPMAWHTIDMYGTLGVQPSAGRLPVPEDDDNVAVISDALWHTWFGRDPSVLGKWYFVNDSMRQVIGVMPASFHFPIEETAVWIPLPVRPENVQPGNLGLTVVARLKEGVTPAQLSQELTQLSRALPERFGGSPSYARFIGQYRPIVAPLLDRLVQPAVRTSLWVLLGAVAVVLLIACANVANLFMVRAESRRRDLTVRRAIGASRGQLVRYQMAESFAVAMAAGVAAIVLSKVTLPLFLQAAPPGIPRLGEATVDLATVGATFVIVIFVALVCGAIPAIRASAPDLAGLREGGRGSTGGRRWARDLLVVGQTALALVLLIGSALLVQSFQRLRAVNPGYSTNDIYTFQFAPQQPQLTDGPSFGRLHLSTMERLRALPGVSAVGVVNNIPLDEQTGSVRVLKDGMAGGEGGVLLNMTFAGGDYFRALGIPLLRGRTFTDEEAASPNSSVLLSRSAAERLWPGEDPVGRRIRPRFGGQDSLAFTVVGVVGDVKQNDWRDQGEAIAYFPLTGPMPAAWALGSPAYVIKSPRAESLRNEVRALVREIAPEAPVYREYTMEFLARRSMIQLSFTTLTLGVVSALALILGVVGLYGVLSYVVAQRTREIGVRMALGATARVVRRQVVSEGTRVVLAGVTIGIAAALYSTRLLGTLLFDVKAVDPIVFAAMAAMMIGMGMLASYLPARRASSVDPIDALRRE